MNLAIKILFPVLIFIGAVFSAKKIQENKPEPRRWPQSNQSQAVEAKTLESTTYQVEILSQGTVKPSRESSLVPEITGTITQISDDFVAGGFIKEGDLLVEIDRRDYEIALTQTKAARAQANAVVQEERARSKQAQADWKSLGRKSKPSALTIRGPQLAAASANLASADAQIEKAMLDLERTRIIAPYDGRVLENRVDVGEFVSRGAELGRIHSIDSVEVRLPISNRQLTYLSVPNIQGDNIVANNVTLSAEVGGKEVQWPATLVRSEGIDTTSQQLYVVVKVDNPYSSGDEPLRIGQYVKARITGEQLENVFVVPRSALREDREVVLVDKESNLKVTAVTVAWADDSNAAISAGLTSGDILTLTALGSVANGTPVQATVDGVAPPPTARGQSQNKGQNKGQQKDQQKGAQKEQQWGQQKAQTNEPGASPKGRANMRERIQALKAIVDEGGDIPVEDKERIKKRIAEGGRVPPWLKAAVEK